MEKYTKEKRLENLRVSNEEINLLTKESIQTALVILLGKKRLEKISIVELVNKAGVSRASFYNNYSSKEEVLLDMARPVLHIMSGTLLYDEEIIADPSSWFKFIFDTIKENNKLFQIIFIEKIDLTPIFMEEIDLSFFDFNVDLRYVLEGFKTGIMSIAEMWMNEGMKESTQEMADICKRFFVYDFLIKKSQ